MPEPTFPLIPGNWYWLAGKGPWRFYRRLPERQDHAVMRSPFGGFNTFAVEEIHSEMTAEVWERYRGEYESRMGKLPNIESGPLED